VIDIGQTYVPGKDTELARALLDACDRIGVDQHEVRATDEGFILPSEVWDEAQRALLPKWVDDEATF